MEHDFERVQKIFKKEPTITVGNNLLITLEMTKQDLDAARTALKIAQRVQSGGTSVEMDLSGRESMKYSFDYPASIYAAMTKQLLKEVSE